MDHVEITVDRFFIVLNFDISILRYYHNTKLFEFFSNLLWSFTCNSISFRITSVEGDDNRSVVFFLSSPLATYYKVRVWADAKRFTKFVSIPVVRSVINMAFEVSMDITLFKCNRRVFFKVLSRVFI